MLLFAIMQLYGKTMQEHDARLNRVIERIKTVRTKT